MLHRILLALLPATTCLTLQAQTAADPAIEPPSILEVDINGQRQRVRDGGTIDVNGTPVTISVTATRELQMGRISFDYPRHFAYAYDGSQEGVRNWTLDGNDVVVMFFEFATLVSLKDLEAELVNRFGRKNCHTLDTEMRLGGRNWKGRRIEVTLVGTLIMVNMLDIPLDDGFSRFLILQDTRTEGPSPGEEVKELQNVLDRTIRYD